MLTFSPPSLVLVVPMGVCGGVVVSVGGLFPIVDSPEDFFVIPPGFLDLSHKGVDLLS